MYHDKPTSNVDVRDALIAAGCRRMYVPTMTNIIVSLINSHNDNQANTIAKWKVLRAHWFDQ